MNENTTTEDAPERRPFGTFLQEQRHGALHAEVSDLMQEIVRNVIELEKTGSLTITLKVAPTKDGRTVFVTDEVKAKVPQPERGGSIMFTDANGNLSRRDPTQMTLDEAPLRAVPAGPSEVKSVPMVVNGGTEVVHVNTDTGEVE